MARICICTAMSDSNRGIGLGNGFPWPHLKRDYEYYTKLTQKPKDPHKKFAQIKGRRTWLLTSESEKSAPTVVNVIISSKLSESSDPHLHKVVASFDEAVEYVTSGPYKDVIETIWVMGGTRVYESAINHPRCSHIYLTRVFGSFKADTYFPRFEHIFTRDPSVKAEPIEDNGVTYQFEVYQRMECDNHFID